VVLGGHVLAEHRELVAAEPAHGVLGTQNAIETGGQGLKELVVDLVAERVVHGLEAVEVEEQQRRSPSRRPERASATWRRSRNRVRLRATCL